MDKEYKRSSGSIKAHKKAIEDHEAAHEAQIQKRTQKQNNSRNNPNRQKRSSGQKLSKKERMRRKKIRRIKALAILLVLFLIAVFAVVSLARAIIRGITGDEKEKPKKDASSISVDGGEEDLSASATFLATGDIIMHKPFLESSMYLSNGTYDYNSIYKYIKDYYESADFVTTTIEGSITDGDYYGYPTFRTPEAIAAAAKANGTDMILLANNHVYDNLDDGLQTTINYVEKNDLLYTGVRKNTEEKPYLIQEINGIKVGMINYVFETESNGAAKAINGIPVTDAAAPLINSFNSGKLDEFYTEMDTRLKEMREAGAEFTVAYMHWGVEYDTVGTEEQRQMAQKLCDLGLDALIGSHPHVIQPVDYLTSTDGSNEMLVAYAIGNQISNQRTEYMDGLAYGHSEDGYMVKWTIERDAKGIVSITSADFIPIWMYHSSNGGGEYYVLPLDKPEDLKETGLNLGTDVEDSLKRTNDIISTGVDKVKNALPLS